MHVYSLSETELGGKVDTKSNADWMRFTAKGGTCALYVKIPYSVGQTLLYIQPLGASVCWSDVNMFLWGGMHIGMNLCRGTLVREGERQVQARCEWLERNYGGEYCIDLKKSGRMLLKERMTFNALHWVKWPKVKLHLSQLTYQQDSNGQRVNHERRFDKWK